MTASAWMASARPAGPGAGGGPGAARPARLDGGGGLLNLVVQVEHERDPERGSGDRVVGEYIGTAHRRHRAKAGGVKCERGCRSPRSGRRNVAPGERSEPGG